MKCLSIQQPWAWSIVHGPKRVENRTWGEGFGGPLLLHAGKSLVRDTPELRAWFAREVPGLVLPAHGQYPLGCIVGAAVVRWTTRSLSFAVTAAGGPGQASFCDTQRGTVYWVLGDVVALPRPVPWRGERGLFEVDAEAVADQLAGWPPMPKAAPVGACAAPPYRGSGPNNTPIAGGA